MAYCIGLTGGIGSGKSSAAGLFHELGAGVVDTDQIAHELTGAGGETITAIRSQFGTDYIAADGGLDRGKMRRLVFSDSASKKKLEAILHPLIRRQAAARIAEARQPYVLVVVPLLFETGAYRELVSRVLVVDCTEERQIARTMQRSRLTADEVRAINEKRIQELGSTATPLIDWNQDGCVDFNEFAGPIRSLFTAMDRNEDDKLDPKELNPRAATQGQKGKGQGGHGGRHRGGNEGGDQGPPDDASGPDGASNANPGAN